VVDSVALAKLDRKALPAGYCLEPDIAGFRRKLAQAGREMIGAEQRDWLRAQLAEHGKARRFWFLFGSQTILSSYVYPDLTRFPGGKPAMARFNAITRHGLPTLNLDAWDGYPTERDQVYALFEESGANVLTLSGDSHMAWINEPHRGDKRVGLELSATTLTGPSIGELMPPPGPVGAPSRQTTATCCGATLTPWVSRRSRSRATVIAEFVRVLNPREGKGRMDIAKRAHAHIAGGRPARLADRLNNRSRGECLFTAFDQICDRSQSDRALTSPNPDVQGMRRLGAPVVPGRSKALRRGEADRWLTGRLV
jgi:hypothetical protein